MGGVFESVGVPMVSERLSRFEISGPIQFVVGDCLVNLLSWRSSIERLMRSLNVVVMHEHHNPLANAQPTAHPRIVETVDSHLQGLKPLFNQISVGIVDPTVQP